MASSELSVTAFGDLYGISRQKATKHAGKRRWMMPDGVTWHSRKHDGKWWISRESGQEIPPPDDRSIPEPEPEPEQPADQDAPAPPQKSKGVNLNKPITPEALKALKIRQEILLLQNRNDRIRSEMMADWTQCMYRAFSGMYGAIAGRVMALRLDKATAARIDKILLEEADALQERIDEEIKEYENENKTRVRV